jgi:hypothetical protein
MAQKYKVPMVSRSSGVATAGHLGGANDPPNNKKFALINFIFYSLFPIN